MSEMSYTWRSVNWTLITEAKWIRRLILLIAMFVKRSGETLLKEEDRHVDGSPDSLGGDESLLESSIAPLSGDDVPERAIDATIASLESQVDHLCSLLDKFRSEFQTKLNAFREDIRNLPEHVGVAYSPRQRAYLLRMYGKSIAESGELALHKLQHDLEHLISLEGDARPYEEYCSVESSFVSCRSEMESAEAVPEHSSDRKVRLRPFTSLLQSVKMAMLAPTSSDVSGSFVAEAVLDVNNRDEHPPGHSEEQASPTQPQGVALRPHREVLIDWERFCGDCPARAGPPYCKGCSAWRRGFEDPTWDGRESRRESVEASVESIAVEDFAW